MNNPAGAEIHEEKKKEWIYIYIKINGPKKLVADSDRWATAHGWPKQSPMPAKNRA